MARPPAKELTERELEVMHVFWKGRELTAQEVRDDLAAGGRESAYTTVATLVRILDEKGFISRTNEERPFRFQAALTYEEVSGRLLGDLVEKVFGGSSELLLVRLMEQQKLSEKERALLESILADAPLDASAGKAAKSKPRSNREPRS